ncbi:MAG TPA: hypothetical protein VM266_13830 [Solirubrobacteraceae bacterium]|nr:hypothetical protein [Solirubrobacteraceae bacterium]
MDALGSFGRRLLAWLVLALAALLTLKLIAGTIVGVFQTVMTLGLVLAVGAGLVWALRRT